MTSPDLARLHLRIESLEARTAKRDLAALQAQAVSTEMATTKMGHGFKKTGAAAAGLRAQAAGLARTLGPLIGAMAGLAAARGAISTYVTFEKTMAQVQGTAIKTTNTMAQQRAEMAKLEKQARQLGATTAFTATQAGEAQLFLARAGFEVQEIYDALPGTLDLAVAGVLDLGTAADIASNVLNQFNLEAKEMGHVGDILVNTANSANTNVEQLAEALKFAGPVAGALGIELEAAAAALGTMGDAGIQSTLAGTQLRGVMLALIGPTAKAERRLQALAARSGQSRDAFDLTKNTMEDVFKAFGKAGTSVKEFNEIFGRRQAAGAIVLAQNVEKFDELAKQTGAAGRASELAAIQMNTLWGSLRSLVSAIQEVALAAGSSGLGMALKDVVDFGTNVVRVLAGMDGEAGKASQAVKNTADVVRNLAKAFAVLLGLKLLKWLRLLTVLLMKNPIITIITSMTLLLNSSEKLRDAWGGIFQKMTEALVMFGNTAERILTSVAEGVLSVADFFGVDTAGSKRAPTQAERDRYEALRRRRNMRAGAGGRKFFENPFDGGNTMGDRGYSVRPVQAHQEQLAAQQKINAALAQQLETLTKTEDQLIQQEALAAKTAAIAAIEQDRILQLAEAKKKVGDNGITLWARESQINKQAAQAIEDVRQEYGEFLALQDEVKAAIAAKEAKEAAEAFQELADALRDEIELLGKSEGQVRVWEAHKLAAKAYGDDVAAINQNMSMFVDLVGELDRKQEAMERFKQNMREVEALSRDLATEFSDVFKAFVFGEQTAEEAIRNLIVNLASIVFDQVVARPLIDMLSTQLTGLLTTSTGAAGATFTASAQTASVTFQAGVAAAGAQLVASASQAASIMGGSGGAGGIGSALSGVFATGSPNASVGGDIGSFPIAPSGCGPGG